MTLLGVPDYNCQSETDVEQKFIYPLLTHPSFLNFPAKTILGKKSLGTLPFVSKSALPRNYIPDYILFYSGLPICIIEAKQPDVSVAKAMEEARLYAQVVNQHFPAGINPVSFVMGCNGRQVSIGRADTVDAETFEVGELLLGSAKLKELRDIIGHEQFERIAKNLNRVMYPERFSRASRSMDQQLFLAKVQPNALAPYLNQVYEMFFRAEDPEKIQLILNAAYVDTAELREYDNVLHVMLRQIENRIPQRTIQTDRHREYTLTPEISRYGSNDAASGGRLHLIIGSRGSGKSLFISRFFSHLMPERLKREAVWFVIDFNRAPDDMGPIDDYMYGKLVEDAQNLGFDQYHIENLEKIFSVEVRRFRNGPLSLISDASDRERAISNELMKLTNDKKAFAKALARHVTGDTGRPLIVALDNVDRRKSEQQLAIFQAAQSFRTETRAFCLLTLRDVTFDRYKGEPPLDTFAQLNNFYIRPPRFSLVLQKRLTLALSEGLAHVVEIEQASAGGMRFRYSKGQLGDFLRTVYDALFAGDQPVGRIVDALAERDVREALGMFARILASGHFDADRVIGIGTGGSMKIAHDQLIKILMRADYKLYSEENGFIFNIFATPAEFSSGNIFLTAEILGFYARSQEGGRDKMIGYWRVEELIADLASMGFEEEEVRKATEYLIKRKLLAFDGEDTENAKDGDLIKMTPSGYIHLRNLPNFIEYISSIAMHCSVRDAAVARGIADMWGTTSRYPDLNFVNKHTVASIFSEYLVREKSRLDTANPIFKSRCREADTLVNAMTYAVNSTASIANSIRQRRLAQVRSPGETKPQNRRR